MRGNGFWGGEGRGGNHRQEPATTSPSGPPAFVLRVQTGPHYVARAVVGKLIRPQSQTPTVQPLKFLVGASFSNLNFKIDSPRPGYFVKEPPVALEPVCRPLAWGNRSLKSRDLSADSVALTRDSWLPSGGEDPEQPTSRVLAGRGVRPGRREECPESRGTGVLSFTNCFGAAHMARDIKGILEVFPIYKNPKYK